MYIRLTEVTPTADTEILGVYGSSVPIHSVNAPPRKRGSMPKVGERTFVVRAKRPNVEAFGAAVTSDASTLRSLEFSSCILMLYDKSSDSGTSASAGAGGSINADANVTCS
ncbi:hypothetical protein H5410_044491 [Solanum commersonii]|uniref:Uncharacterized protein n=1 Tax=Solanum commersonii TaxID=4109 RepID=A0A9J5X6Z3_SOLCO|nr:hypothetical protein H5410_044491 [Solanum commersonii]